MWWVIIAIILGAGFILLNKYVIDPFMMDMYWSIINTSEWMEEEYESTDKN